MTPRTSRFIAALAATASITACTTTAIGSPHAERPGPSTSQPPNSSPSGEGEAPRVAAPLDASAFAAAPCTTLTTTQLPAFAVEPPGTPHGGDGIPPACSWFGADGSIGIAWLTANKGGLSDTYRGRDLEAYFIETSVEGYPAVFVESVDARAQGACGIVVGVSDTLTFFATVDNGQLDADGSCAQAKQVAAAAITSIKEAN